MHVASAFLDEVHIALANLRDLVERQQARYKPTMKKSGPTKSYAQRVKDGLRPVFVWLPPEAAEALDNAVASSGGTMTDVIVQLLLDEGLVQRAVAGEAPIPVPKQPEKKRTSPAKPGSSVDAAAKVREGGMRRQAIVVSTGQIARDGTLKTR